MSLKYEPASEPQVKTSVVNGTCPSCQAPAMVAKSSQSVFTPRSSQFKNKYFAEM